MTPDPADDPLLDRAAYQLGRWQTLAVVVGTGSWWMFSTLKNFAREYTVTAVISSKGNPWLNLLFSGTLIYILCSSAWRGGKTSTGCLTILYSVGLVGFVLLAVVFLSIELGFEAYRVKEMGLADLSAKWAGEWIGQGLAKNVSAVAAGVWVCFAFWTLVLSRDARFYREMRRRCVLPDAFSWPPDRSPKS